MPDISVIMPVYNSEKYLSACVQSVLDQTYADFELICVDDGSTDSSAEILETFAKKDSRVRVIRQKNGGGSASRNTGLDAAKGDFIAFIDNDDCWHPDYLKTLRSAFDKTPEADVAAGGLFTFDAPVPSFQPLPDKPKGKAYSSPFLMKYLFRVHIPMFMWTKLYRKRLFETRRFAKSLPAFNDILLNFEVLLDAKRLVLFRCPLYAYRQHAGQQMHKPANEAFLRQCAEICRESDRLKKTVSPLNRLLLDREIAKQGYQLYLRAQTPGADTEFARKELRALVNEKIVRPFWITRKKRKELKAFLA